jgi:poly(ribitol-phosphate) beta-N-acetylglucosaminyltransferase
MKKTLSCESLHGAVYFAPDMLRHCCKRFFRNEKMQGDVEVFKVSSDEDITYEKIVEHKKKLYDDINAGKETPCTGCPWLVRDHWKPIEETKIRHISVEVHSVCNMRCEYCSDIYYGGKQPSYAIEKVVKDFLSKGVISKDVSIVWGGGEPTLLKNFDNIFHEITSSLKPRTNYIFTNVTVYKEVIAELLRKNAGTIVVSIDAGTPQTFKKVRGLDAFEKVFRNLQRYASIEGQNINIKYILMEENSSEEELLGFVENVQKHNLEKCTFQISANYKLDGISDQAAKAAFFLYKRLKGMGIQLINFDDHLKPRIKKMFAEDNKITESIIIWGAGEYARRLMQTDKFFQQNRINFFVDKNPEKQGRDFLGYKVKPPEEILEERESKFFIASALYFKEIYEELVNKLGVSPERIIDNPVL